MNVIHFFSGCVCVINVCCVLFIICFLGYELYVMEIHYFWLVCVWCSILVVCLVLWLVVLTLHLYRKWKLRVFVQVDGWNWNPFKQKLAAFIFYMQSLFQWSRKDQVKGINHAVPHCEVFSIIRQSAFTN